MNDILRYFDAEWNISGLFAHDDVILFFYDILASCGIRPKMTVHGNIPCAFNSGRIIRSIAYERQQQLVEAYAERGIPILLTFSNYKIDETMLNDTLSNKILGLVAGYPHNGAIVGSDLLRDYITDRFSGLFLSTSILRVANDDRERNADYYRALSQGYDRVVLHPDDGFDLALLSSLEGKDKFEIIINENCVRGCPHRKAHNDIVCSYYAANRDKGLIDELNRFKKKHCKSVQDPKSLKAFMNGEILNCNMSQKDLENCYKLGYRCFKLQGRSSSAESFLFDVTRYMLMSPSGETLFKFMMDRIDAFRLDNNPSVFEANYTQWDKI